MKTRGQQIGRRALALGRKIAPQVPDVLTEFPANSIAEDEGIGEFSPYVSSPHYVTGHPTEGGFILGGTGAAGQAPYGTGEGFKRISHVDGSLVWAYDPTAAPNDHRVEQSSMKFDAAGVYAYVGSYAASETPIVATAKVAWADGVESWRTTTASGSTSGVPRFLAVDEVNDEVSCGVDNFGTNQRQYDLDGVAPVSNWNDNEIQTGYAADVSGGHLGVLDNIPRVWIFDLSGGPLRSTEDSVADLLTTTVTSRSVNNRARLLADGLGTGFWCMITDGGSGSNAEDMRVFHVNLLGVADITLDVSLDSDDGTGTPVLWDIAVDRFGDLYCWKFLNGGTGGTKYEVLRYGSDGVFKLSGGSVSTFGGSLSQSIGVDGLGNILVTNQAGDALIFRQT